MIFCIYTKILFIVSITIFACTPTLPISEDPEEAPQSQEVESSHPLLFFPDIIEIQNMMPLSGVGERPQLEWQMIQGAELYGITVFEPDGTPYWAWRGNRIWVYLGGIDEPLLLENEGPIIVPEMTWQVVAYNGEEIPIAAGGPWPIAP